MKFIRHIDGSIRAMKTFTLHDGREILRGTWGGRVDSVMNLSQTGSCWVLPNAEVSENAYVSGNAIIEPSQDTSISMQRRRGIVTDNAKVYGNAVIQGGKIRGNARILGDARVENEAEVGDDAVVQGNVLITGRETKVLGKAKIQGDAIIDNAIIGGKREVPAIDAAGNEKIYDDAVVIMGSPLIFGTVRDQARVSGCAFIDAESVVEGTAHVTGGVKLINSTARDGAIIKGDHVLEDAVIEDSSLATNCPDKVAQQDEQCDIRAYYLANDRSVEGFEFRPGPETFVDEEDLVLP